jgi:hypothetical protein
LISPDGKLTINIPAGALTADMRIGIQPIANLARGGIGGAYRLMPEGVTFAQPVQLRFAHSDPDREGASADALGIAFQDAQGYWRRVPDALVDKTTGTVTVSTTHFSDWSRVKGAQIRPPSARVKVKKSVALQAMNCMPPRTPPPSDSEEELAPLPPPRTSGGEEELAPLPRKRGGEEELAPLPPKRSDKKGRAPLYTCDRSEGAITASVKDWSVNGIVGGDSRVGTVRGNPNGTSAIYTAPSFKPSPATVAVSAQVVGGSEKSLLVSNITIEGDDVNYTGTVQFSMTFRGGEEVSGSADVAWTEFEHPEEEEGAKWYLPSGMITANLNMRNCDPVHVTGPIETGSPQNRRGGTMTIFPVNHLSQPRQYFFGLVGDRNNNIKLCCASGKNKKCFNTSLSHYVNFTIGQCGESHEPYTDTKVLRGKRDSERCRLSWKFTAQ